MRRRSERACLDLRREHTNASVALILRTLVADGRPAAKAVSLATVRRLCDERSPTSMRASRRSSTGTITPRLMPHAPYAPPRRPHEECPPPSRAKRR